MKYTLAALLSLLLLGCGKKEADTTVNAAAPAAPTDAGIARFAPGSPKLNRIVVEPVKEAEVPLNEVTTPGKVEVNQNRVSQVVLPLAGRITAVEVHIGDFVKQGQPLFTMESPDVEAAVANYLQSQASVNQSKAALGKAQSDYERSKDLFEHNAIAKKEVISAESALRQAEAMLEQSQAVVNQSRRRLELLGLKPGEFNQKVVVRAPISGKVMEMSVVPGEFRNDLSAALMKIADLSSVWVTADVPETQIRFIKPGEVVGLELAAYPGERFQGHVKQVADVVDPQTRTVKVRAELANAHGKLKPEMFGQIKHVDGVEKSIIIPASAALLEDASIFVWKRQSEGVFRKTQIVARAIGTRTYAVSSGLDVGDSIVTDGALLIKGNGQ